MIKTIINVGLLLGLTILINGCNYFFDKDNTPTPTPLTWFKPDIQPKLLWSTRVNPGVQDEYLKTPLGITPTHIFVTSRTGIVTAVNKANGQKQWQINTHLPITTGAAVNDHVLVIGTREGDVIALDQSTGRQIWRRSLSGGILATPAIAGNRVIVKSTNGTIHALSLINGWEVWTYQQVEPALILRGSSNPVIRDGAVIVGFANGNLAKLNLTNGQLQWLQAIAIPRGAFAIQRMIDINADPILYQHQIYAATYQGRVAALSWISGENKWSQEISTYTGMVADHKRVYLSDAMSLIWTFDNESGLVEWRQNRLQARDITGPALMNGYLVVGDKEGYLHWLNTEDGHLAAREKLGEPIYTAPFVDQGVLYVLTAKGTVSAYTYNRQ